MQIHDKTRLSIRAYIKQSGWQNARLKTCPINPGGDCRLHRHGTYARKYPDGMRVACSYCRSCRKTFSLLPTFMAAGCPGTLDEIEKVVLVYEECGTVYESLRRVRAGHGNTARAQRRWLQRRVVAVHLLLATVKGLFPDLYSDVAPTLASFRHKGPLANTLMSLRIQCDPWLQTLPRPVGFHRVSYGFSLPGALLSPDPRRIIDSETVVWVVYLNCIGSQLPPQSCRIPTQINIR